MRRHAHSCSTLLSLFSMAFTNPTSSHWNLKPTADTMPDATVAVGSDDTDDELIHDFSPLLLVYKNGRLERPLIVPLVPPGLDAATGVESKDVPLSSFSFVRLYLPPSGASPGGGGDTNEKAKLPVVVYFHGGGFVFGSAASSVYHRFLNDLAAATPAIAVSVDYRLAPEHMLPAAYEDSLAALKWVLSAGADPWLAEHGDLTRVFLVGDSAGGNICHNLAMHQDVVRVGMKGTVLIHPWFWGKEPVGGEKEHRRRSPAAKRAGGKRKKHLWEFVCPGAAEGVDDHRMNPMAPGAPGMERMACEKVMVCVGEGDHLRWRGMEYAEAVARAKMCRDEPVEAPAAKCGGEHPAVVELFESVGVGHVFHLLDPEMEEARRLLGRVAAFVRAK